MNFFKSRINEHGENDFISKVVVATSAAVLFFIAMVTSSNFGVRMPEQNNLSFFGNPNTYLALVLTALFIGAIAIFLFQPKANLVSFLFVIMMVAGLMAARGMLLNFVSGDYLSHLSRWMTGIRAHDGLDALGDASISNYSPPYMYILWILARFTTPDYLPNVDIATIKFVSILFDVILAYFVMKIVSLKYDSVNVKILAFVAVLAIPTVLFNSALWAQSDSIYAAFAIGAIYFGLKKQSVQSLVFFALAFSFKMQAVFILPIIVIFIIKNHIKPVHLWVPFAVFGGLLIPSILAGMLPSEALGVYFGQFDYYVRINMNSPNIWALINGLDGLAGLRRGDVNIHTMYVVREHLISAGIFAAGVATVAFVYSLTTMRDFIKTNAQWVQVAYLSVAILPFLLPKMHDRYFFIADVLAVVLFIYCRKFWYVPLVTILASFTTYTAFLFHGERAFSIQIVSLALLVVIILVLKDLIQGLLAAKRELPKLQAEQ